MNKTISVKDLHRMIKNREPLQLVDVRSPGEYDAGHVPQAINVPLEQLEARIGDLHEGRVAVLCQSGRRAGIACDLLSGRHDGLLIVEGGTQAWIEEGLPVVRTTSTRWSLERQVRLGAGVLVLLGTVMAALGQSAWLYLAMFVGAGLTFAGLTNVCGMAILLAKLPWNRPAFRSESPVMETVRS
jgi:rhodanese-related sulfurtransferase